MVQAVNQRGRSPRSPSGQPHARRYFQCSFLGSLGVPSHSVIAANHCTTVRVNTMTVNTDLKCAVSLLRPLQLRNGREQILATMCPNSSDTWSKWDIIYLKKKNMWKSRFRAFTWRMNMRILAKRTQMFKHRSKPTSVCGLIIVPCDLYS